MFFWGRKRNTYYIPDLYVSTALISLMKWKKYKSNTQNFFLWFGRGAENIIRAQYMSGNYEGEPVHFSFWMWPDQVLLLSRFLWIAQAAPNLIHGHCTGLNTGDTFWSTSHPKSPRFSSQTSHLSRGWIQWTIGNWCLTHLRENLLAK